MKEKFLLFGWVLILLIVVVPATTDEQLNDFFNMYGSNFQISTLWAGEATTPEGQIAKLAIVKIEWTDNEGNDFQERRFYASFQGSAPDVVRHFSDGQNIETLISYPSGDCEQKAPDRSCGVESFDFLYSYPTIGNSTVDNSTGEYLRDTIESKYLYHNYHRYYIQVDPATGQATSGVVKEIVTDAKFKGKADIEETPPNIQNKQSTLAFINQNGIISEDTTTFYYVVE